jgi:3-hydroxybutyrate dehydrogenase
MMKLDGKVALITGAASGIGYAIAQRYLEADGRVVIADLDPVKAAQAASQLGDKKTAIGIRMDVSNEEEVNTGVDQGGGGIRNKDILVSNAGIQIVHPIEEFPFADWKKLLAIHLDGAFLTTKA